MTNTGGSYDGFGDLTDADLLAALTDTPVSPAPSRDGDTVPDSNTAPNDGDTKVDKTDDDADSDKDSDDDTKGLKAKVAAKAEEAKKRWPKRWTFRWWVYMILIGLALYLFCTQCAPGLVSGKADQAQTQQSQTEDGPRGRSGADIEQKGDDELKFNAGNGYIYLVVNGNKVTGIRMDKGISDYDTAYFGTGAIPKNNDLSASSVDADRCDQDNCTFETPRDLCTGWFHVVANVDDGAGGLTNRNFTKKSSEGAFDKVCS